MNTRDILSSLRNHPLTRNVFKGVYSANTLPNIRREKSKEAKAYVFNLDPSYLPGSHWVAVYSNRKGIEYFDSYGLPPSTDRIRRLLGSRCKYNTKRLQSFYTTVCGQYCLYFIWKRCHGQSMETILQSFGENTTLNDLIVNSTVNNVFETEERLVDWGLLSRQTAKIFQPWHMEKR